MKPKIGVVGAGFVGGAIARGFALTADVKIYDKDPKRSVHSFAEVCEQDFVFLCLPTPMVRVDGGEADLSIVYAVCEKLSDEGFCGIAIIKSTVPIGTTRALNDKYRGSFNVIHNPEFLTARNADIDFLTPARTILGGELTVTDRVAVMFRDRFPGTNLLQMTSNESEAVKYVANCFFAVKVLYFNEVNLGLKEYEIDWDTVMKGVLTDGRIGISHCEVPGHDGKYGYGGSCVLPEATVRVRLHDFKTNSIKESKNCSVEELLSFYRNGCWLIESTDAAITDHNHLKQIQEVTCREVNEELYEFHTENGIFTCTADHLMPVERNGEKAIIPAKEIKDSDKLFSKK
jgi:UDPglucose 6-dehydrogenase